ncbi:MAG: hypothetical protein CMP06_07725 [Xanthomonadales bacterium]|nr:hypothetical protein [Xanthomonadales bacterium]
MHAITTVDMRRRELLRYVFYTGAAVSAAPLLTACGQSESLGGTAPGAGGEPGGGTGGATPMGELTIPSGPLANIGDILAANADDLLLPDGFTSRIVARAGAPAVVGSGYTWHNFPDGGATYLRDNGGWIYTSNSETLGVPLGGVGTLVFDPDGTLVDSYQILSGTTQNCAGGKTPWDTWVSCEETSDGLCWECDPYNPGQGIAKPSLGLFAHEAIAVDQRHGIVYLTEDSGSGRFYRWVADPADIDPATGRMAFEQGTLQCMNVAGYEDGGYEADDAALRELKAVSWVDALNPDQPQGDNRGPGTVFQGGEGLWFYELPESVRTTPTGGSAPTRGLVFFTTKGDNRVWAFDVENQLVELIFDNSQIDPGFSDVDNLTVSPAGDILVAEDNPDTGVIRIMVVIPNQPAKVLVQLGDTHTGSEICGPAFSPDGSRLYFSSQRAAGAGGLGQTFEVTIPQALRA